MVFPDDAMLPFSSFCLPFISAQRGRKYYILNKTLKNDVIKVQGLWGIGFNYKTKQKNLG